MVELMEETGVQRSLTERLVRSKLQWAGHEERMADDRLPKRAAELREQGRRRRGRPRLRWEDCVKRYVRNAGEEKDWKKTRDRGGWKRLPARHPWQRERRGRERYVMHDKKVGYEIAGCQPYRISAVFLWWTRTNARCCYAHDRCIISRSPFGRGCEVESTSS